MECKNCKAALEQDVTICPQCGTDNAQQEEEVTPAAEIETENTPVSESETENTPAAESEKEITPAPAKGILLTPGKLVAVIAAVVLLTAAVVAMIMTGMGFSFSKTEATEPAETTLPAETEDFTVAEPTTPADGNPDDETCKGSYTVSDEQIAADKANVVATVADRELTNAELQIYYWMEVQGFLSNYGSYASYLGLDYTQPLDTQLCGVSETTQTWQQYFLALALADWHNYASLAEEAELNGYELEEEYANLVAGIPDSLEEDAVLNGFENAEEYLIYNVGMGSSIEDYQSYMNTYYQGFMYFQARYDAMIPDDAQMEAYYAEHAEEYAEQGVNQEDYTVDIRHILILPDGADLETIYTDTFPEESWTVSEAKAEEILNEWLSGEKTEESFAAVANQYSADPGSNTNGGLYTDVAVGDMVEAFDAWCFDPERQVGDYDIVRTELGFHIMYFSGMHPVWKDMVLSDMMAKSGSDLLTEVRGKHPITVDYSLITLGYVDMNK